MSEDVRIYRPYQREINQFILNHIGENIGVEGPPGCGKTMIAIGLTAQFHKDGRYWKLLIATTQEQIENRFVNQEFRRLKIGRRVLCVPDDLIVNARCGSSVRKQISSFLKDEDRYAMACTHAAIASMDFRSVPQDLSGYLLVLDEGHHAPADELSKFEYAWKERGGCILYMTATSYRSDGRKVGPETDAWFVRSMAQHMEEGFAPYKFESEIRAINGRNVKVSYSQLTGKREPPRAYIRDIVRAMIATWVELRRPKTIVRVPPMIGGSRGLIRSLVKAFCKSGARTVDATGPDADKKKAFLAILDSEARCTYRNSKVDVIIGCQRVAEGTDWRHCEAVFCVGLPGSMTFTVQLTGRPMRMKDDSCPKFRRERARALFFVPTTGKEVARELSLDHSRAVLLQTCFMADSQSGQRWLLEKELRRFRVIPKIADQAYRAEIILRIALMKQEAVRSGAVLTVGACIRRICKLYPQLDEELVKEIVTEALLKSTAGRKVRRRLRKLIRTSCLDLSKNLLRILDKLIYEFRDATLDGEDSMELLGRQTHGLTGKLMFEWADRLVHTMLSEESIIEAADNHHRRWEGNQNGSSSVAN